MKYSTLKLGEILVKDGAMTEESLRKALKEQKDSGKRIGEILIKGKYITEKHLIASLSSQLAIDYIDLDTIKLDPKLSEYVPESIAKKNIIVPIEKNGKILKLAVADPLNYNIINDVGNYSKLTIQIVIAEQEKIEKKIYELYVSKKAFAAAQELSR
ncbi:MAG TPA: type II secretion system protein GspE, partial [Clostridia bacterium]|nr:type II secretion system protein GspE [Clostridia bacterium]